MQVIDLDEPATAAAVASLCKKVELTPPTGNCKKQMHHGKYNNGELVSLLSIKVFKLNETPGSTLVSIDIAASVDPQHSMSTAFASIVKTLRKRKHKCVISAQVDTRALPFHL